MANLGKTKRKAGKKNLAVESLDVTPHSVKARGRITVVTVIVALVVLGLAWVAHKTKPDVTTSIVTSGPDSTAIGTVNGPVTIDHGSKDGK